MRLEKVKEIELYTTKKGEQPFGIWLDSLKDKILRYRIKERLDRVTLVGKIIYRGDV